MSDWRSPIPNKLPIVPKKRTGDHLREKRPATAGKMEKERFEAP